MDTEIANSFTLKQLDNYILLQYHNRFIDEENDIKQAIAVNDAACTFLENVPEPANILVNTINVKINTPFTKEATQIYTNLIKHNKIDRIAMVGKTEEHTYLVKLMLGMRNLFSKRKIGWFSNLEEANLWLSI